MDGLILLRRARDAGLAVAAENGKLVIRGPRQAEPVAKLLLAHKPEVLTALDEAADWRARLREALAHWGALHPAEAEALAWSELQCRWHRLYGGRVPREICAGCREPVNDREALDLADGCRVHFDRFNCLLRYGDHWRGAATEALAALGLQLPAGAAE
jgi:hypothetical protein